jgi:hypothetical protein
LKTPGEAAVGLFEYGAHRDAGQALDAVAETHPRGRVGFGHGFGKTGVGLLADEQRGELGQSGLVGAPVDHQIANDREILQRLYGHLRLGRFPAGERR